MFYTYIIQSKKDSKLYTGFTHDLRKRFRQHNSDEALSTKFRGPFEMIYYEACRNEQDGRAREKYFKLGMGKRYLKNRLKRFPTIYKTKWPHTFFYEVSNGVNYGSSYRFYC